MADGWTAILQKGKNGPRKKARVIADTMEAAGAKAATYLKGWRVVGVYRGAEDGKE